MLGSISQIQNAAALLMSKELDHDSPSAEWMARGHLLRSLTQFCIKITSLPLPPDRAPAAHSARAIFDGMKRRRVIGDFLAEVMKAAEQGIEVAFVWHSLAAWLDESPERIACYERAFACMESERLKGLQPEGAHAAWIDAEMGAECLYETGRIHLAEGKPDVARDFLRHALPLAKAATRLGFKAGEMHDSVMEAKIAGLLRQLPGGPQAARHCSGSVGDRSAA